MQTRIAPKALAAVGFMARRGVSTVTPAFNAGRQFLIDSNKKIQYLQPGEPHRYYPPLPLLKMPVVDAGQFTYNRNPLSKDNRYGRVDGPSNHGVSRGRYHDAEIYPDGADFYVKNLSFSQLELDRNENTARFLACLEAFSAWMMQQIFGPDLIPHTFVIRRENKWGIASKDVNPKDGSFLGTLGQITEDLQISQGAIAQGDAPFKVIKGQTHLLLPDGQSLPAKGRIGFKVALYMFAHSDVVNCHNNVFAMKFRDPVNNQDVACPGMFDLGNMFDYGRMLELIGISEHAEQRRAWVKHLAEDYVEDLILELRVRDYEEIIDRYPTKRVAFNGIRYFPGDRIKTGIEWLEAHAPEDERTKSYIHLLRRFFDVIRELSEEVVQAIEELLKKDKVLEGRLKPRPKGF